MTIFDISCDFETRSTTDLKKSGVWRYAEDPHTDVWVFGYALPGEDEVKLWLPEHALVGSPEDDELRELAADPSTTWRAHNAQFEYVIWNTIMHKRYGFPRIEIERWYCTAAECAALALPRALDNVARVLGVSEQKDMKGAGLMLRMAKPRNAAAMKKDPTLAPTWWDDEERKQRLYAYNAQDVRTERAVAQRVRRLNERERAVWLADARINERGVMIDRPLIDTMMRMGDAITKRTNAELRRITNGRVEGVTKPKDIVSWLNELAFDDEEIASIAKDKIDLLLAKDNLPDAAREVLGLRVEAGKSSVSKLTRMLQFACADDRMRNLLLYHGASTGRWSGKGPQVQNFPARSPWLSVDKDLVEHMLPFVRAGALDAIDICYPVLEVLALCLRACLRAAPGYRFIGGDFSQIEARVLAWLAGQSDLLDLFATGADVYKPMAAAIYNVAVEAVTKAQRDMGKRAILGCFEADTPVLTQRGWVPILNVKPTDLLYDGVEWVSHGGVAWTGRQKTLRLQGIGVTPGHMIAVPNGWVSAYRAAVGDTRYLKSATDLANGALSRTTSGHEVGSRPSNVGVHAARNAVLTYTRYAGDHRRVAIDAPKPNLRRHVKNIMGMPISALTTNCETDYSTAYPRSNLVAATRRMPIGRTMAGVESVSNLRTDATFSRISYPLKDILTRVSTSTESTITAITPQGTCVLQPSARTSRTVVASLHCKIASISSNWKTKPCVPVFDILNAGPRHRFTILTEAGPLIVHNCGYGMGWEKFIATTWKEARQVISEPFSKRVINTYREKNDCIVDLWRELDDAAISAVKQPGAVFYAADGKLAFTKRGDYLWIVLPSKRLLAYHKPEIRTERTPWGADKETVTFYGENQKRQWVRQKSYGGFWAENVTQAVARDLMAEAMLRAEDRGYPIVLTAHDELLSEVPQDFGSAKEFEELMCVLPPWAAGLPVKAEVEEMQCYKK